MSESIKAAEDFVEKLFINGGGQKASRLLLWNDETKRDLGGWSRAAIADQAADFAQKVADEQTADLRNRLWALENLEEAVGMWCESCPVEVQEALHALPWIYKVHFAHDFEEPEARTERLRLQEEAKDE